MLLLCGCVYFMWQHGFNDTLNSNAWFPLIGFTKPVNALFAFFMTCISKTQEVLVDGGQLELVGSLGYLGAE